VKYKMTTMHQMKGAVEATAAVLRVAARIE
jgi:hypothetical protein